VKCYMAISKTRAAIENVYQELQRQPASIDSIIAAYPHDDSFSNFDMLRLHGGLENAVEMYGEVLGYITYEDDE